MIFVSLEILQYDDDDDYYYYYYPLYCFNFVLLTAGLELLSKPRALSGVIDTPPIVQL